MLDWFTVLSTAAKSSKAIYDRVEFVQLITSIRRELDAVYADLADAQFNAALSAIRSATHSVAPEHDLRSALTHMRAAYYTYEKLLSKKRTVRRLIFFETEVLVLDVDGRFRVTTRLSQLAACLAFTYAALDEPESAREWRDHASRQLAAAQRENEDKLRLQITLEENTWSNAAYATHIVRERRNAYGEWEISRPFILTDAGKEYVERNRYAVAALRHARRDGVNVP